MGELWAFPISLRLGLIENLRRYADHIVRERKDIAEADDLADRLTEEKSGESAFDFLATLSKTFKDKSEKIGNSPTFIADSPHGPRRKSRDDLYAGED